MKNERQQCHCYSSWKDQLEECILYVPHYRRGGNPPARAKPGKRSMANNKKITMKKKLIIDVNSEERANFIENFVQTHLASFVERPTRLKHDLKKRTEGINSLKKGSSGLSQDQEKAIKDKFYDQHYKGWIDSPLPILKGKTPRQAIKIKTERQKVIDLLKDLINSEFRTAKKDGRTTPYNFDWLFAELGVEKDLL